MASTQSDANCNLTHCAICDSEYERPRLLNCLHSFCHKCLDDKVSNNAESQNQFISCPACREETLLPKGNLDSLPINEFLQSKVNRERSILLITRTQITQCQSCQMEAEIRAKCLHPDCGCFLCATCEKAHRDMLIFRTHNVVYVSDNRKATCGRSRKCPKHPELPQIFYCEPCMKILCIRCKGLDHSNHYAIKLAGSIERHRQTLEQSIPELTRVGTEFKQSAALAERLQQRLERYKDEAKQTENRAHMAITMSQLLLESDDSVLMNMYPHVHAAVKTVISSKPGKLLFVYNTNDTRNRDEDEREQVEDAKGRRVDSHEENGTKDVEFQSTSDELSDEDTNGDNYTNDTCNRVDDEREVEDPRHRRVESHEENGIKDGICQSMLSDEKLSDEGTNDDSYSSDMTTSDEVTGSYDYDGDDDDDIEENDDDDDERPLSELAKSRKQHLHSERHPRSEWKNILEIAACQSSIPLKGARGVSISPCNRNIAIADHTNNRVDVFSVDGRFKFTVRRQKNPKGKGKGSYRGAEDVAFNSKGHLFVVDTSRIVHIFKSDGAVLTTFDILKDTSSRPRGQVGLSCITIDHRDLIYIGDYKRYLVIVLTGRGKCIRHVRSVSVSIPPMYLAVNDRMEVLVTRGERSSTVLSIQVNQCPDEHCPAQRFNINKAANVTGVVWDKSTTGFFVASQQGTRGKGQVHYYSKDGKYVKTIVTKLFNPLSLALSSDNVLVVADLRVVRFFA